MDLPTYYGPRLQTTRGYVYGVEKLRESTSEVRVLNELHWKEIARHNFKAGFRPDYERLITAEHLGRFLLFTARDAVSAQLVGIAMYTLESSLWIKDKTIAFEQVLYVAKPYRKHRVGVHLLRYAEGILNDQCIDYIMMGDNSSAGGSKLERFLVRLGYKPIGQSYLKRRS